MTRPVALRRAGGFTWPVRLAGNAEHESRTHVTQQEWLGDSVKGFALTLAIGLWPMLTAPGLSALESEYPSTDERHLDQTAQRLAEKGKAAFDSGEYAAAIRDYSELLRLKPQDERVLFNLGLARLKSGDTAGALKDFSDALALNSDLHVALVNRARIYLQQGRQADAITDLARAERLHPGDAMVLYYRGTAYSRTGEFRRAIAYFTRTLELNALYAPALAERGHAFLRQGAY